MQSGPLIRSDSAAHDREVFLAVWQIVFGVLSRLFEAPLEDAVMLRVLGGLSNLATIAAHFRLPDALELTVRPRPHPPRRPPSPVGSAG